MGVESLGPAPPPSRLCVAPPPFIVECSSGDVGQPAGSLLLLPECQNGESGEAGPSDRYGHCSLSAPVTDILPWGWLSNHSLFYEPTGTLVQGPHLVLAGETLLVLWPRFVVASHPLFVFVQ